jgi:hypothetical protein
MKRSWHTAAPVLPTHRAAHSSIRRQLIVVPRVVPLATDGIGVAAVDIA